LIGGVHSLSCRPSGHPGAARVPRRTADGDRVAHANGRAEWRFTIDRVLMKEVFMISPNPR
jgi:hypothetical protein